MCKRLFGKKKQQSPPQSRVQESNEETDQMDVATLLQIIREYNIRVRQRRQKAIITDGYGSVYWPAKCPNCGAPMQIIRPGDCRCSAECYTMNLDELKRLEAAQGVPYFWSDDLPESKE